MNNILPTDQEYFRAIDLILKNGEEHQDRTGVGTKRVFGEMFKFDLQKEFPIITCKPAAFKNTVRELLAFVQGEDSIEYFKSLGGSMWRWWDPFKMEDGTIGPIYPTQWRRLEVDRNTRQAIPVKIKSFTEDYFLDTPILKSSIDGVEYESKSSGKYIITNKISLSKRNTFKYDIQFIQTGYEVFYLSETYVKKQRTIKDVYLPIVNGVGYKGEYKIVTELDRQLYDTWRDMIARCYSSKCKSYKNYGAKGVTVCNRWLNFSLFRKDCSYISGWISKKTNMSNYILDKDYYGSKIYSKDTCVWLLKIDNNAYSSRNKPFKAVDKKTGKVFIDISQKEFSKKHSIDCSRINDCLNKNNTNHKLFHFSYLDYDESRYVYRYPLPVDQILNCIDLIKQNPDSRRICFTGWNPVNLYKQNLAICHGGFTQFQVSNGKLNMSTVQRSMDVGLGCPANWASYAMLQHMIANVCNLEVGTLTYYVNDLHIYNNHIDKLKQMKRKSYSNPILSITKKDNINDYVLEDFDLINYKAGPKINLEMAI